MGSGVEPITFSSHDLDEIDEHLVEMFAPSVLKKLRRREEAMAKMTEHISDLHDELDGLENTVKSLCDTLEAMKTSV